MDIDRYIKKSNSNKRSLLGQKQKFCLKCGKQLENEGTHLWFQNFCSEKCKEEYIEETRV
ncbi:MAG: hypothetical protein PHD95_06260 [Candidatus ainarchaeum sp.]|nr:hypothetical protein [Candidatus ainarchaeum sp.]